jgi:GLPGLI family protein
MFKRMFFTVCLFAAFAASAQKTDTALAGVRYTLHYVTDTTQPGDISVENMILFIGERTSVFRSYDKYLRDSTLRVQFEEQAALPGGVKTIVSPQGMKVGSPSAFYKDPATNKLSQLELFLKYYLIEEDMPAINWTVTQETKNIHDLPCQKATTTFRGRNYTAWFCSQLPYNNGPWKLGGLPGLIIEAEDDKKEVVFSFDSFENVAARKIVISMPGNAIATTKKDFIRLRDAAQKDPQSVLGNSAGETMFKAMRSSGPISGPAPKRKVNNNPIEKNS